MSRNNRRLTLILIPHAGKRSLTLQLAPGWFLLIPAVVAALAMTILYLYQNQEALQNQLAELEELRRVNRIQQAEIDTMSYRAQEAQQKLQALSQLEQEIREFVSQGPARPSRSGSGLDQAPTQGRGGPQEQAEEPTNIPSFTALLPREVTAHLLTRRDTLGLHLLQAASYHRNTDTVLAQASATSTLMDEQIRIMDHMIRSLDRAQGAIVDHIDYLAHVPSGMPVTNGRITDRFGWRWSPFGFGRQVHNGIDLAQEYWAPIAATGAGKVVHAGWKAGGYGYTVIIDHGYGYQTLYAHMVDWDVKVGDTVERGAIIGWVGSSGNSTGPHVHYEVHLNGVPVDPTRYF